MVFSVQKMHRSRVEPEHTSEAREGGHTMHSPDAARPPAGELRGLVKLQAAARGALARRNVSVTGSGGQVTVKVKGGADVFEKVGLGGMTSAFPKSFQYQAVDAHQFEVNIVGSKKLRHIDEMDGEAIKQKFLTGSNVADANRHSLINGGFFNWQHKGSWFARESMPIGTAEYLNKDPKGLPIPKGYEDQYVKVDLGTSSLHTAPELSREGVPKFGRENLEERRFQYTGSGKPGALTHANHPNPRSGISFPAGVSHGQNTLAALTSTTSDAAVSTSRWDAVRMASVSATRRGPEADGMTLPEFSNVMARLDRMNLTQSNEAPVRSVNLDGGGSVYNARIDNNGKTAMDLPAKAHGAPNFVIASEKKDEE